MTWTVVGAIAAVVAAGTGVCLVWWAWRDRSPAVVVSVVRWRTSDIVLIVTATMKRGRPMKLYGVGIFLRDGSRGAIQEYRISEVDKLPCELKPRHRATVAVSAEQVHQWLIRSGRGAEDVDVGLYLEDGVGQRYEWGEWAVFNATTGRMTLPSDGAA